jgi:hypothetical protein
MKMSSLLALDATDCAIGNFFVGLPVQRDPDRKTTRWLVSNYLNTANGLAPRPLSNSLQALLAESPVARSDRLRLRHTMRSKATWPSVARYPDLGVYAPVQSLKKQKPPGFCRAALRFTNQSPYSPLPKRRDHHPARRGWVSVAVSEAGWAAGAGGAGGSGWLGLTGGAASRWASTRKLTFSRTVERRRAALSAS